MKAILVIDINDELLEDYENFYVNYDLRATNKEDDFVESIRYVEDCNLKPMPQKKYIDEKLALYYREYDCEIGYNKCIDDILGKKEC